MTLLRGPSGAALLSGYLTGALILASPVTPLLATTYYVDPLLGLDSRLPTEASRPDTPWQSLTHAVSQGLPGDTIQLAAGTYSDSRLSAGGHESFPIALQSGLSIVGDDALLTTLKAPANVPLFVIQESLTERAWLAGLTLDHAARTGQVQNADILLSLPVGTALLGIDSVHFGEGSDAGLRVLDDHSSTGDLTALDLTVNNSTFSGAAGIIGELSSFSSALDLSLTVQDSAFIPTDAAIMLEQQAGSGSYSLSLSALACSFVGGTHAVASHRLGTAALGSDSWTIEGSRFDTQGASALSLLTSGSSQGTGDTGWADIQVLNNQFVDGQDRGIFLSQSQLAGGTLNAQTLISGNTFSAWANDAIVLSASALELDVLGLNTTIEDNLISLATSSGDGIVLSQSAFRRGTVDVMQAVRRNTIEGASASGLRIVMHDLEDLLWTYETEVRDNLLQDLGAYGVALEPTQLKPEVADVAFTVSNNTIAFSQESGFWFRAASLSGTGTIGADVVVEDNDFRQVGLGGGAALVSALYTLIGSVSVAHTTTFSNNSISRTAGDGILVSHAMTASAQQSFDDSTLIFNNQIEDAAQNGIKLRHSYMVSSGAVALNTTVVGNEVNRTGQDGIHVSVQGLKNADPLLYSLDVFNNSLSNTENGIVTSIVGVTEVAHFNLELGLDGNRVEESVPQGAAGIVVEVRDLTQITGDLQLRTSGNVVKNKGTEGLSLSLSSQDVFSSNAVEISDNVLTGNGVGLALSSQDYRAPHILVSGNTIQKSTTYGALLTFPTSGPMTPANTLFADFGGGTLGSPGLNSFLKTTSEDALRIEYGSAAATLPARGNTWPSTDPTEIQAVISSTGAAVDVGEARSAQPSVRASSTLTAFLLSDEGAEGVTQGDTVRLIAQLANTGELGCAATFFSLNLPEGTSFVNAAVVTKGAVLEQTDATLVAGLRESAAGEVSSVQADVRLSGSGCDPLAFQGAFSCEQLGTLLTDDPGTLQSAPDAAVVSFSVRTLYTDLDGDGQGDPNTAVSSCASVLAANQTLDGSDCDDSSSSVKQGGTEVCDGLDNDCDGQVDVSADGSNPGPLWYIDQDKDGFGSSSDFVASCSRPENHSALPTDCNDSSDQIYPGNTESCNAVDDNCDGATDEGFSTQVLYPDMDNDGYGDSALPLETCQSTVGGTSAQGGDCNDQSTTTYPGAEELCDRQDNNCDGSVDNVVAPTLYLDADGDGYGTSDLTVLACPGSLEGFVEAEGDCDDQDPAVSPAAEESCNLQDDTCDGQVDEGFTLTLYYPDADGDGYGVTTAGVEACQQPADTATAADDCDDLNHLIHPNAAERCDGADTDCDGNSEALEACLLDDTPLPETLSIVGNGCSCSTALPSSSRGPAGLAHAGLLLVFLRTLRRRAAGTSSRLSGPGHSA